MPEILRRPRPEPATVFAALGDATRLSLIKKLSGAGPRSIGHLTHDSSISRQAITKHLGVLENAGLVLRSREGRVTSYQLDPAAIEQIRGYLDQVSDQWRGALARLKSFVENEKPEM